MRELLKALVDIADRLDKKGYGRYADLIQAIIEGLVSSNKDELIGEDKKQDDTKEPEKVKEDNEQIKEDAAKARKAMVDDEGIKDLFDAKEKINEMKRSDDYDLTDDEWEFVYEKVLEDKFKRDYTEKSKQELEDELNRLVEDKKRKGELSREEELEYNMINSIFKRKTHEEVRPSDQD